jgi:ribonuclease BN (tRNA processing enzyme)
VNRSATEAAWSSVTILGSSSSIPRPGRACSCYLVRGAGRAIALDMGSGSFSNLRSIMPAEELDAVVVSHMHPDHFLDLIPLRYALRYGPRSNRERIGVFLPPGGEAVLRTMAAAFAAESSADYLSEVYDIRTYEPAEPLVLGGVTLRFAATAHFIPTFAVRCEFDGASLAYSADTAPEPRVSALARNCDVFLCEATLVPGEVEEQGRGHMTAREAGTLARDAGARRLVLTHYGAETTEADLIAEARTAFDGEIVVADDRMQFALG